MEDQLAAHEGNVPGAGYMALRRQARGIYKVGVPHTQLHGTVVHLLDKQLCDSGHLLRQGHGCVVAAGDAYGLQKLLHADLLSLGQIHLAAAHRGGIGADGDHILIFQLPSVHGLHDQQERHDLGDAGRLQLLMLILGKKHLPGLLFHEQCGLGLHGQLHGMGRQRQAQ